MSAETPGMRPRDPPPGGLARLRASLGEPDRAGLWVERGVMALAAVLLAAVLPELLFAEGSTRPSTPAIALSPPEPSWQPLPSADPRVKLYIAMPVAPTPEAH